MILPISSSPYLVKSEQSILLQFCLAGSLLRGKLGEAILNLEQRSSFGQLGSTAARPKCTWDLRLSVYTGLNAFAENQSLELF